MLLALSALLNAVLAVGLVKALNAHGVTAESNRRLSDSVSTRGHTIDQLKLTVKNRDKVINAAAERMSRQDQLINELTRVNEKLTRPRRRQN